MSIRPEIREQAWARIKELTAPYLAGLPPILPPEAALTMRPGDIRPDLLARMPEGERAEVEALAALVSRAAGREDTKMTDQTPEQGREATEIYRTAYAILRAAAGGDDAGRDRLIILMHERGDIDELANVLKALAFISGWLVQSIVPQHDELWAQIEARLEGMEPS